MAGPPYAYNGLMIGTGAGALPRAIPALTDGQLAIGKTGYPPLPATITGAGGVVVTSGAGTLALSSRGYIETTGVGNVGVGEDVLQLWDAPANTLIVDSCLHVVGLISFAANANAKTVKFYVGGSAVTLNPVTTAPNGLAMTVDLWVWYATASSAFLSGTAHMVTVGLETIRADSLVTTIDWTGVVRLKFSGEATATDDIIQRNVAMLAYRTP